MFRFGLKNMRRLRHVPLLELKPITILVGKNSSGKSTYLRTFPLVRQSIRTRTSSPLLWYGDYVDFGQFSSVVSGGDLSKKITFSFGIDKVPTANTYFADQFQRSKSFVDMPVDVDLVVSGQEERTYLECFNVLFVESKKNFTVDLSPDGEVQSVKLDGVELDHYLDQARVRCEVGSLFPDLYVLPRSTHEELRPFWRNEDWWAASKLADLISSHVHGRISEQKIYFFAREILEIRRFDAENLHAVEQHASNGSFRKFISDLRGKDSRKLRSKVEEIYDLRNFFRLINGIFAEIKESISNTLYIGPVRARSERYYRYQDLAVSEIDPDGKNFPMFLNSLSQDLRADFSHWVQAQFGYGVKVKSESGHISIYLDYGGEVSNIVDNGYGISQVLPVLGQIWWAARGSRGRLQFRAKPVSPTIVIEQPELHLHPAHQALLADAMVGERKASTPYANRTKFIVETHSEALVNRLGRLVSERAIPHDDVQVLVFEDDQVDTITNVRISPFDEEGVLQNWPFGFFQPAV